MLCQAPPLSSAHVLKVTLPAALTVARTAVCGQCSVLRSQEGKFWRTWYDMGALGSQLKYQTEAWRCWTLQWRLLALFGCVRKATGSVVTIRWSKKQGFCSDTTLNSILSDPGITNCGWGRRKLMNKEEKELKVSVQDEKERKLRWWKLRDGKVSE